MILHARLLLYKAGAQSFIVIESTVKESEFHCNFCHMQPSLHCTQFHQKLVSSQAQVVEIFSTVREIENRISKLSIFLKVSQDICSSSSTCLSLFFSNQRMRVGRKKEKVKINLSYVSTFQIPNCFLIGWLQNPYLESFLFVCLPQILIYNYKGQR